MGKGKGRRLTKLAKRSIWLLFMALLYVVAGPDLTKRPPPAKPTPSELVVGSWNLEWFGSPEKRRLPSRSESDLDQIVTFIVDDMKAGVMILNEINVGSKHWHLLGEKLGARGYQVVYPASPQSLQETALVYDSQRVRPLGQSVYLPQSAVNVPDCRPVTPRSPVVGSFVSGNFDFTLAGVHLKAPGDRSCGGDAGSDLVRTREVKGLLDYIVGQQRAGMADKDVIVIGDLNSKPSQFSLVGFLKRGMSPMTIPTLLSPESGPWSYRKSKYNHALDHLYISAPAKQNYVPRSASYSPRFSQFNKEELENFRRHFSDHSPLWARFRVDIPDLD